MPPSPTPLPHCLHLPQPFPLDILPLDHERPPRYSTHPPPEHAHITGYTSGTSATLPVNSDALLEPNQRYFGNMALLAEPVKESLLLY